MRCPSKKAVNGAQEGAQDAWDEAAKRREWPRTEGGEQGAGVRVSKPLNEWFSGRVQAGARGSGRVAQTVRTLQNLQRSTGVGRQLGLKTA